MLQQGIDRSDFAEFAELGQLPDELRGIQGVERILILQLRDQQLQKGLFVG